MPATFYCHHEMDSFVAMLVVLAGRLKGASFWLHCREECLRWAHAKLEPRESRLGIEALVVVY